MLKVGCRANDPAPEKNTVQVLYMKPQSRLIGKETGNRKLDFVIGTWNVQAIQTRSGYGFSYKSREI